MWLDEITMNYNNEDITGSVKKSNLYKVLTTHYITVNFIFLRPFV